MKTLWRKNFSDSRVDYNILVESYKGFYHLQHPTIGSKAIITKGLCIVKDLWIEGFYFDKTELRAMIAKIIETIVQNPARIEQVHKKTIRLNKQYFDYGETLRKKKLGALTNKQLLDLHKKLYKLQYTSHGWSLPTTWYSDSDGEDLTKYLVNFIKQRVNELGLDLVVPSVFSVLSTSHKESYAQTEERESLQILQLLKSNKQLRHFFMTRTTTELVADFAKLPQSIKTKILRHHYKWCWTPYTYLGPAYGLDFYLEVWRGLLHEDLDPRVRLAELKKKAKDTQDQRKQLIKKLKLTKKEQQLFNITADIVWIKGYRKDCYFHGFFVLDLLLAEMARRTQHSLLQVKYLVPEELPKLLAGKDFSETANERMKFSVITGNKSTVKILTGARAKKFLKTQNIEKQKIVKSDSLTGTCACPGGSTGVVRVVNTPEEMGKMNQGDIMLAHTTFPALVPAMKKASAIVTEDGGITCHAAIVARELQIPCVVGCKNALAIFKDGQKVEVDATNGIIKKLK